MDQNEKLAKIIDIRIILMAKALKQGRFKHISQYETYKLQLRLTEKEMEEALKVYAAS